MLDCKRVLDSVKAELHVLDVKDTDPDVIQSHFDKCMVRSNLARFFFLNVVSHVFPLSGFF